MARADLICDLIKYGQDNDSVNFRKVAEAICAEEQARQHWVLASRIEKMLQVSNGMQFKELHNVILKNSNDKDNLVLEKNPQRNFDSLILPKCVADSCKELVEEHMRSDILRSYGLEPRNKVLLIGPPGNGKTTLAEAIAQSLMLPFMIVRYESLVGSYLGETAARLSKLFEYAKERQCILFFDEFETLAKERGDAHETGEIKRVVSSLLLQIDALPSYVIVIAATNHDRLLDHA
ncbi:MAG: ATP-binding protein, partial [Deltaproteobacteria bacterium]|nr:ATP-binding protein [Deltaproteobacteria bacterium]